jgi:hypothetical protein
VLPISYRLIILDTALRVQKSLNILTQNGPFKRAYKPSREEERKRPATDSVQASSPRRCGTPRPPPLRAS